MTLPRLYRIKKRVAIVTRLPYRDSLFCLNTASLLGLQAGQ